jgi:hypothetical protein
VACEIAVATQSMDRSGPTTTVISFLPAGMCLAQAGHRPAHLTRVHQALTALGADDQRRLGVIADWTDGPHQLTCRQTERTFGLVADALGKDEPDGLPSGPLQRACDDLPEASVPEQIKNASRSLAVDWTGLDSFSRPPPHGTSDCADPEAWRGHRKNNLLRSQDELFYGWYLSARIMMRDEGGPAVPELARRATPSSPRHDPVRAFAPVLTAMPGQQIPLGDIAAYVSYGTPTRSSGPTAGPGSPPGSSRPRSTAWSTPVRWWCCTRHAPGAGALPGPLAARAGNSGHPHGEHGPGLVPRPGRGGGRGLAAGQSRGLVRAAGLAHPHLRGGSMWAVGQQPDHLRKPAPVVS